MRFIKVWFGLEESFLSTYTITRIKWAATGEDEWNVTFTDGTTVGFRIEPEEIEALRTVGR